MRAVEVELTITGDDGFELHEVSAVAQMSRTFEELVEHAIGAHHRYPDGFVLFTGTMFAPTQDRDEPGGGFTHHRGDRVTIATPKLGSLVNEVTTAEDAEDWDFGIRALMSAGRGRWLTLSLRIRLSAAWIESVTSPRGTDATSPSLTRAAKRTQYAPLRARA
ncbi:hypothetical protein [Gryllotalpicola reticulitermitis]